ncbi:hypothetical protein JNL27_02820 [bacterium]|nr:hypothetical protein [bacterium]
MKLFTSYRIFFFSLFIAFFLWFYVRLSSQYQQVISIPLQVVNLKEEHAVVSELPRTIPVLFEANGRTLLGLEYVYDVKYVIDAEQKDDFTIITSKYIENVKLPGTVEAIAHAISSRDTLHIISKKWITKRVPVIADIEVSCAPGFVMVGGFRTIPDSVVVRCPITLRDSIHFVSTARMQLTNISADKEVDVELADMIQPNVKIKKTDIHVLIDIQPLGETVMENLPIKLINVPEDVNVIVQPSTFSIKVRGGVDFLSALRRDSVYAVIDYAMEQRFATTQPRLTIVAPRDMSWSQITPARFNLVRLDAEKLP